VRQASVAPCRRAALGHGRCSGRPGGKARGSRDGKQPQKVAVACGAVRMGKTSQPSYSLILRMKKKRASPGACQRRQSPSSSRAVWPSGCCLPKLCDPQLQLGCTPGVCSPSRLPRRTEIAGVRRHQWGAQKLALERGSSPDGPAWCGGAERACGSAVRWDGGRCPASGRHGCSCRPKQRPTRCALGCGTWEGRLACVGRWCSLPSRKRFARD